MIRSILSLFAVLTVIFIAFFLCFYALGSSPLALWDEAVNARVVTELVQSGSYPNLTFLGRPFLEKPPLWYYLTAQVAQVAGLNATSLRVVSAASGFLLMLLIFATARQWYGTLAGIVSAATLAATGHLFNLNAGGFFSTHTVRSADPDMLFVFLISVSFVCITRYDLKKGPWLYLAVIAAATAVLTKGFLGILPLAIFALFAFVSRPRLKIPRVHIRNGIFIFCILALPWYVVMFAFHGFDFLSTHFGYHVLLRALTPLEGHGAPWWFYLGMIATRDVFPFIEILLISVVFTFRDQRFTKTFRLFGPAFMALFLIFIPTIAQTKLSWYIFPLYPFAALLIGMFARRLWDYIRSEKTSSFIRIASYLLLAYMTIVLIISIRANIHSIFIQTPLQNPMFAYNR